MKKKKLFSLVLATVLTAATVLPCYGASTKEKISNAQAEQAAAQSQLDSIQSRIDELNSKKGQSEEYLSELNQQLDDLQNRLQELQDQYDAKQNELVQIQADLEDAKAKEEEQYEAMKLRIQYMYENGNTPMLEMLLSASSFSDFLNRTEYISEINSYDRQKLEEFIQVQEQIAAEEASLEEQQKDLESEQQELLAMQDDMKVKQNSVNSLISSTQANISQTNSELSSAQGKVNDINSQIAQMEELEKQLEIQKAKEDAARMAEIKRQEAENNGEFSYVPSDSDLYLLGAIIQCEADGEPYEGKLAVGSVVMNRVRSSYFPNTVSGVIYQSGQFSPVASGRYALRLEQGVNNTCMQAAQEVLNGNITNSCLYFRTVIDGLEGTIIGHHIFY